MKTSTLPIKQIQIQPKSAVLFTACYDAPKEGRLDFIRLDFNESTSPAIDVMSGSMPASWVCAYPEYGSLLQSMASRWNLNSDCIVLTNGSDEAISVIANTFIEPGKDRALVSRPCFSMIKQCLQLAGAGLDEVAVLPNLEFDIESIAERLTAGPKLAMFASPDNPTGSIIPIETIERWCLDYPQVLFVIDEAYGEYAGGSVIPLIRKNANLLVLKTFSKAWGLAGLRLGAVFGNEELIKYIRTVKLPYSVNSAAVFAGLEALAKEEQMQKRVDATILGRTKLASFLQSRGYRVRDTSANWCLLGAGVQAETLTEFLRDKQILVRNRSTSVFPSQEPRQEMWGWIRVSVGDRDEMSILENAIDRYSREYALIFDLDGTLVDTSSSFDETVAYLVQKYSNRPLADGELNALRLEGGFNDDWVASRELLKRREVEISLEEVASEGERYYLSIAREREELLQSVSLLKRLAIRNRLFIVTGRTRREYAPVWGDRLDPLFERVYCVDDVPGLAPKPSPDYLSQALLDYGIARGAYVGNSVDDMRSARAAGLTAIGVATGSGAVSAMIEAGAQTVIENCNGLESLLMLRPQGEQEQD